MKLETIIVIFLLLGLNGYSQLGKPQFAIKISLQSDFQKATFKDTKFPFEFKQHSSSQVNWGLEQKEDTFICKKENNATLTGKWRLIKYHNLTTRASESEPTDIARSIIIEFADKGHWGKMNGQTVTNTVGGEYQLLKNKAMKTISFGGTKVAEPGWGNKFWDAIHSASSYERHGDVLFVFFNADREKMEFKKE